MTTNGATQKLCKYCNLPIRETHQGHVRNEWEHMNGLSFCADGKHWAWPTNGATQPSMTRGCTCNPSICKCDIGCCPCQDEPQAKPSPTFAYSPEMAPRRTVEPVYEEKLWEKHSRLYEVIECDARSDEALMGRKAFTRALDDFINFPRPAAPPADNP